MNNNMEFTEVKQFVLDNNIKEIAITLESSNNDFLDLCFKNYFEQVYSNTIYDRDMQIAAKVYVFKIDNRLIEFKKGAEAYMACFSIQFVKESFKTMKVYTSTSSKEETLEHRLDKLIWKIDDTTRESDLAIENALLLIKEFAGKYRFSVRYEEEYIVEIHFNGDNISVVVPDEDEEWDKVDLCESLYEVEKLQAFANLLDRLSILEERGFRREGDILFLNSKQL